MQDEDTQPIETPIIASAKTKAFAAVEHGLPETTFDFRFLAGVMDHPNLIRNVAILGHLHHGKTSFVDLLVQQTHVRDWDPEKLYRYTDARHDEQQRELSIKCSPMSLIIPDSVGKSYLINAMDTPGHVNFSDEQTAAIRLADGVIICVDAVEGVMLQTERSIKHALQERLPIVLLINKVQQLRAFADLVCRFVFVIQCVYF